MKIRLRIILPILAMDTCLLFSQAQSPSKGIPPEQRLESHQGRPGQPDVIAHKHISKGTHLECIQVEHYPKQTDDGAACVLKFENGDKLTLPFAQVSKAPVDGEVYLECVGDKPTRCTVGWWSD